MYLIESYNLRAYSSAQQTAGISMNLLNEPLFKCELVY